MTFQFSMTKLAALHWSLLSVIVVFYWKRDLEVELETWIGIDFKYIALILFFVVGYYVNNLRDKVADLENEIENLKFDIRNSSHGFFHVLSSESIKRNPNDDDEDDDF